jgi:hypothetical protein
MNTDVTREATMKFTRRSLQLLSGAIDKSADHECGEPTNAQAQRLSWRRTIDWLTSPAFRLHHYRNVHTQMLRRALCNVDCGHTQYDGEGTDNE